MSNHPPSAPLPRAWLCVAPVKVVDIADVAKQGVFVLGAQRRAGLVADALQVVLERNEEKHWLEIHI